MIALLQRVTRASVDVNGDTVGAIGPGLLVLLAVERGDSEADADRLLERLLRYRVFGDDRDRMNLSLADTGGGLLVVPQFTLAADTDRGNRPSFTPAAPPEIGERLFNYLCGRAAERHGTVAAGQFGADMKVTSTNDGPVTIWLQTRKR